MTEKLLTEVSAINKKYALINQKTGAYFNIFDIIGVSSDEIAICKLLREFLSPIGSHYQGDAFLRLFITDVLRLNFSEMDYLSTAVYRERVWNSRRIDLFIISLNYMIPIEVKIFAGDQDKQCFDYHSTKRNADLYYLTLDGHLPSPISAEGLNPEMEDGEIVGYQGVKLLSFKEDIANWLNKCLALPEIMKIAPIREILFQFKDILNRLTGQTEGGVKMEIVNTIMASAENMKNAIDIANALPEAKTGVMLNFFRELKRLFEQYGRTTYDYDDEVINQFYFSRKPLNPYLSVEIAKLPHNLTATLCIEVDGDMYYSFAFTEVDKNGEFCEFKETEWVKSEYPAVYNDFNDAVQKSIQKEGEKSTVTVFWDYVRDDKDRTLDFKNFSPSCVDLAIDYTEQAKHIFTTLDAYIQSIASKLNKDVGADK